MYLARPEAIPDEAQNAAYYVSNGSRYRDESGSGPQIEFSDLIGRRDHVQAEDEVDERLRRAEPDQNDPQSVPNREENAEYSPNECGLVRFIRHGRR